MHRPSFCATKRNLDVESSLHPRAVHPTRLFRVSSECPRTRGSEGRLVGRTIDTRRASLVAPESSYLGSTLVALAYWVRNNDVAILGSMQ